MKYRTVATVRYFIIYSYLCNCKNTPSYDMKPTIKIITLNLLALTLFFSCNRSGNHHRDNDIEIQRYESVIFDTPDEQLETALRQFAVTFNSPLLHNYPDDEEFMSMLYGFKSDSMVCNIYKITKNRYNDLSWLEKELTSALEAAKEEDDEIEFNQFATFVSCSFDYTQRVNVDRESGSVLISIDQYALKEMESYSYFGLPQFIVERCDSIFLISDIMAEIARQYIAIPDEKNVTMLDLMISEGKVLYFLDKVLPDVDDNIKIRYSKEQMKWAEENEGNIWTYFIQNNLLYEKDLNRFHNFVDEAPKTNAFKDSAPRTTEFIGWQIVRKYMENNNCSMKELFANTDSQSILQASKYKPQK